MSAAPATDHRTDDRTDDGAHDRPRLPLLTRIAVTVVATAVAASLAYVAQPGGGETDVLGPGEVEVTIGVEYSRFSVDRLRVRPGTLVRFVVVNDDPIHHELIVGPPEVHARHATGTEAAHPPVPGEVSVLPNSTATTVYRFDEPGTVEFACHLPGHLEYGMRGVIEVVN